MRNAAAADIHVFVVIVPRIELLHEMRFRSGIGDVLVRKEVVHVETTQIIDAVRDIFSEALQIVGDGIHKAIIVQPYAAGNLFFAQNQNGVQSQIFETRADEQRHFEGSGAALGKELDASARFDGRRNIALLALEGVAADTGIERRRGLANGIFIAALIASALDGHAPLFQLSPDFRLQSRAIREFGTHERSEQLGIARSALPIVEGKRRHRQRFGGNRLLVLFEFDINPLVSYLFEAHEIERRKDISDVHFDGALKRNLRDRLDAGRQESVFVGHRERQIRHRVRPRIFDQQRGEQRSLGKIVGIGNDLERLRRQGNKFFCFLVFLCHIVYSATCINFLFYYTLNRGKNQPFPKNSPRF